jgi:hypothetical protein
MVTRYECSFFLGFICSDPHESPTSVYECLCSCVYSTYVSVQKIRILRCISDLLWPFRKEYTENKLKCKDINALQMHF